MKTKLLGRTGVSVSELCFGTMSFGGDADEATSAAMYKAVRDAGINFFDCADEYNKGKSEEILGKLSRDHRDNLVLTTKCFSPQSDDINARGSSRRHVVRAVERSLKRLQTDRIDLYQCHHWDFAPIEETLRAMDDLIAHGKVVYWGTSNFKAWHLTEATLKGERLGQAVPVTEQCPYSILNRHVETELAPFCMKFGVRMLPWSPLNAGRLSGLYRKGKPFENTPRNQNEGFRKAVEKNIDAIEALARLASELGRPLPQLAYAFLYAQPHVASVIAGPRTIAHLDEAIAALDLKLDPETLKKIDAIVPPGTAPDYVGW